jgi:tetratricopeptide (TPR) repeat protein
MDTESRVQDAADFQREVKKLYDSLPVTEENSRLVRSVAWAVLANVSISDYLNRWNEAADHKNKRRAKTLLDDAEKAVGKALELNEEFALAHYARGLIYRAKGDGNKAIAAFDQAIKCDDSFARAYAQKASELINDGDLEDALSLIKTALDLSGEDQSSGMFYWNRGRAHFFADRYPEAIEALTEAVKRRPNLWHNWLYLASAHALSGNQQKAEEVLGDFYKRYQHDGPHSTLTLIKSHEKANPTRCKVIKDGRKKFYKGLSKAGMAP